jgi:hypothetical protein
MLPKPIDLGARSSSAPPEFVELDVGPRRRLCRASGPEVLGLRGRGRVHRGDVAFVERLARVGDAVADVPLLAHADAPPVLVQKASANALLGHLTRTALETVPRHRRLADAHATVGPKPVRELREGAAVRARSADGQKHFEHRVFRER